MKVVALLPKKCDALSTFPAIVYFPRKYHFS
jgi:hypothetical protein